MWQIKLFLTTISFLPIKEPVISHRIAPDPVREHFIIHRLLKYRPSLRLLSVKVPLNPIFFLFMFKKNTKFGEDEKKN